MSLKLTFVPSEVMQTSVNVLSLFDGMSCGQIALNRNGIKVDNYYAAEIDKHASTVTQHNFPDTILMGDVICHILRSAGL